MAHGKSYNPIAGIETSGLTVGEADWFSSTISEALPFVLTLFKLIVQDVKHSESKKEKKVYFIDSHMLC